MFSKVRSGYGQKLSGSAALAPTPIRCWEKSEIYIMLLRLRDTSKCYRQLLKFRFIKVVMRSITLTCTNLLIDYVTNVIKKML
jgi:hypothetical protein